MAAPNDVAAQPLRRLARLVQQRRAALELNKEKAAQSAGVAYMTYSRIEVGEPVQPRTHAKIEKAFSFRPGSCRAVLDGATSIVLTDGTELIDGGQISYAGQEELPDAIRQAVSNVMIAAMPDATGRDMKAMGDGVINELRRRGFFPELGE